MKLLNGKKYFTKSDLSDILLLSKEIVKNPYSHNKLDFIHALDSDEKTCIIFGMDALFNTFSWEFTTESALNLSKIDYLTKTLDIPSTEKMDFDSYQLLSPPAITSKVLKQYENWLKSVGHKIFLNEVKKS
jgi:hypothetical protein